MDYTLKDTDLMDTLRAIVATANDLYERAPDGLGLSDLIASTQEVHDLGQKLLDSLEGRGR
jgi:hypothetical protein